MRAAHGRPYARGDLVADDHAAQERFAVQLPRLPECERRCDGGRAGVVDAVAKDVVELCGMRGGAVDERRSAGRGGPAERKPGTAAIELLREPFLEQRGGRKACARVERGVPVDHRTLGVMQHFVAELAATPLPGERGEALDDVHQVLEDGSSRSASRRIAGHSRRPMVRRTPGL